MIYLHTSAYKYERSADCRLTSYFNGINGHFFYERINEIYFENISVIYLNILCRDSVQFKMSKVNMDGV